MYKRGFNDQVYFTRKITAEICAKCDVFVIMRYNGSGNILPSLI
ncbi:MULTISPECIES: hypothetical protein [Tepidanaerobacter]|uniref:Uncharacterized protein n=1 Tax=Tepidanaerobacter syntrophicus TaxID=224999 RepID=A0A0U9HJ87_9FIRM|nr:MULTISPECIES: hypothetical protein [Tepidanaerobacter]GAQ25972.1 hypothetical protein TSYNT_9225 [Tepidanaerobacter syntrophicus]